MANPLRFQPTVSAHQSIAVWLLICAFLVFAMVVLGGVTRLTNSGLSIVEWKPIMGTLPPLSDQEWQETFAQYQAFPEYQKINRGMSLTEFKSIFWFEYLHRLLGRSIGVAFLFPFFWFWQKKRVPPGLMPKLTFLFVLGGLQGLMGWYMVKSGLVDDPRVSQYRLAAHLALAFLIYAAMIWLALGLLRPAAGVGREADGLRRAARAVFALISVTVVSGAFVAGLDAGFDYNSFPLMDGRLIPEAYLAHEPAWRNIFENVAAVQFNHRVLGIGVFVLTLMFVWRLRRVEQTKLRQAALLLGVMAVLQPILGVATLLAVVPVSLGALHQAGALLTFSASLWVMFELRPANQASH